MVTISSSLRGHHIVDSTRLKDVIRSNILTLCQTAFPAGRQRYGEWQIGNTAGDPGDSLGIQLVGNKAGLFHDRATGEGGDFASLVEVKLGLGFREAVQWIERTIGIRLQQADAGESQKSESIRQPKPELKPVLPELSVDQLKRMAEAAHRLARNPEFLFTVLGNRPEISTDAVKSSALDGDLGFEPDCKFGALYGPALLFGYSYGIKARWSTDLLGERHIRWVAGGPGGECWRQSLLRKDHQMIFITEGETDSLAGLSLGLEDEDVHSLVLGLAGASILPRQESFAGRKIIVSLDPDEAGNRAAEKLEALLNPVAASVTVCEGGLV